MPILKNLTFTSVPARSHDPVAARRAKLVERLEEQKQLIAHSTANERGRQLRRPLICIYLFSGLTM